MVGVLMKIQLSNPSSELKDYVVQYWQLESAAETDLSEQLIYPTASTEMMFHYGRPFVSRTEGRQQEIQMPAMLCGQKTVSAFVRPHEEIGVFVATFTPVGASVFIRDNFSIYRDSSASLESIIGNRANELHDNIGNAACFEDRVRIIEKYLRSSIIWQHTFRLKPLIHSTAFASRFCFSASVEQMAREACVSFRTLDRLFQAHIGLTPKEFLKIERLKFAIGLMRTRSRLSLTEIALDSGYFDQPHFNKDFKNVIGITPAGFRTLIGSEPVCLPE